MNNVAFDIPTLKFSLLNASTGAIPYRRFVKPMDGGVQLAAADDAAVIAGVTLNDTSVGQVVDIARGVVIVEASAAIAAGAQVASAADGKAKAAAADGVAVGVAITKANAAGEFLTVLVG